MRLTEVEMGADRDLGGVSQPGSNPAAAFAAQLRELRMAAGNPSFRKMAQRSGCVSHTTLHEATTGARFPSWQTTREFVKACGADAAQWRARWEQAGSSPYPEPVPEAAAGAGAAVEETSMPRSTESRTGRRRLPPVGWAAVVVALVATAAVAVEGAFAPARQVASSSGGSGGSGGYDRCPRGYFCLFDNVNGAGDFCTWVVSDPVADQDCSWIGRGRDVASVFNRSAVRVEYYTQEEYAARIGSTLAGGMGNLAGTYAVLSLKFD
jgi:hypothetical protein